MLNVSCAGVTLTNVADVDGAVEFRSSTGVLRNSSDIMAGAIAWRLWAWSGERYTLVACNFFAEGRKHLHNAMMRF